MGAKDSDTAVSPMCVVVYIIYILIFNDNVCYLYSLHVCSLLQAQRHAIEQARKMKTLVTHNAQLCDEIADLRRKCNKVRNILCFMYEIISSAIIVPQ